MKIIKARPKHAALLSELTWRSKAHWGYSPEQMEVWRADLTITADYFKTHTVYLFKDQGLVIGYYAFELLGAGVAELDNLFVDPNCLGHGYGRYMLERAFEKVQAEGCHTLRLYADPHATAFYETLGFVQVGEQESSIPERFLPIMEYYFVQNTTVDDGKTEVNFQQHKTLLEALRFTDVRTDMDLLIISRAELSEATVLEFERYRNDFYEINLIRGQQQFSFAIDGKRYHPQGEPYICFVASNQLQSYKIHGVDPTAEGYYIWFSKALYRKLQPKNSFEIFFRRDIESYYQLTNEQYENLEHWFKWMHYTFKEEQAYAETTISHLLAVTLLQALRYLKPMKNALSDRPNEITHDFLELIEQDQHYRGVSYYANEMALTRKQLNQVVKKTLGKTALKVIQQLNMEKAKTQILQSSQTFSEIAYNLGFEELSNFSRLFKRVVGCSPQAFRLSEKTS